MGASSSLCISDACTQETQDEAPFTKSLKIDSPREEQHETQPTSSMIMTLTSVGNSEAEIMAGSPRSSSSNSTYTDSQQSVLTAISPTKDRPRTPERISPVTSAAGTAPPPLDMLFVKSPTEEEHVDKWSDVRRLVQDGELRALVDYAAENKINLQSLRFEDTLQTVLHVAVLYNHADLVRFFIQTGVNINVQDKDGMTAIALAFQGGNNEIINTLTNTKALEFAGSPYSPYALSLVSGLTSVHSKTSASALHRTTATPSAPPAEAMAPHEGRTPFPEASPISSLGWESARPRAFSTETPNNPDRPRRLTLNSPATGCQPPLPLPQTSRAEQTTGTVSLSPSAVREDGASPPDSVQRRMTLVGQALEQLVSSERQRSLSLPACSPTFAAARAGDFTAPLSSLSLSLLPPTSYSADHTPQDGNSPRSTLTGGDTTTSGTTTGLARPPLGKQKTRRPMAARLRKAAGRAMSMIVPTRRAMPPRPATPIPAAPTVPATATIVAPAQHARSASSASTSMADDNSSLGLTDLYGTNNRLGTTERGDRAGIAMEH